MSIKLSLYKTALRKKAEKGFQGYPLASVIYYGPDDRLATKVAVGIKVTEEALPEMTRWYSESDIRRNANVLENIVRLIRGRQVQSVAMVEQILGCPHEEGSDYKGDVCPECPFWANRPRPIIDDEDSSEAPPPLPDRRAIERMIAGVGRTRQADAPLEQAQEIMWDAWDETKPKRRIELAHKALTISEDCADAFVLLAEETTRDLHEAMQLFEKGIRAGERALGEEAFTRDAGHFWGILETRPYMRARAGLANCLLEAGKLDDAIPHYVELLRLNPNDNQGNRDMLSVCLIGAGRDRAAEELLERYPEGITASWCYTAALLAFRSSGSGSHARDKLRKALQQNPHVPALLLGRKRMPRSMPPHYQIGAPDEAVIYADLHLKNWQRTEGALEWLSQELAATSTVPD